MKHMTNPPRKWHPLADDIGVAEIMVTRCTHTRRGTLAASIKNFRTFAFLNVILKNEQ